MKNFQNLLQILFKKFIFTENAKKKRYFKTKNIFTIFKIQYFKINYKIETYIEIRKTLGLRAMYKPVL